MYSVTEGNEPRLKVVCERMRHVKDKNTPRENVVEKNVRCFLNYKFVEAVHNY
jgi:hypothetical protein